MHFNIYIDNETGSKLKDLARKRKETRNALIRRAIQEWVDRSNNSGWPKEVLDFQGMPGFPAFESYRGKLIPPPEDPLS